MSRKNMPISKTDRLDSSVFDHGGKMCWHLTTAGKSGKMQKGKSFLRKTSDQIR